jgi:8-oxo-dGTP diphosphatase
VLVVAAAIVADGRVLVAQRDHPPELAGRWEFPGGRVRPGESATDALMRECREELGIQVQVGPRVGRAVPILGGTGPNVIPGTTGPGTTGSGIESSELWLFACTTDHASFAFDHAELRWLTAGELDDLDWLPSDRRLLPALVRRLVTDPAAEHGRESRTQ